MTIEQLMPYIVAALAISEGVALIPMEILKANSVLQLAINILKRLVGKK